MLGFDPFADVALLEVDPDGLHLHPLELGSDGDLVVGQPVAAIGSPSASSTPSRSASSPPPTAR